MILIFLVFGLVLVAADPCHLKNHTNGCLELKKCQWCNRTDSCLNRCSINAQLACDWPDHQSCHPLDSRLIKGGVILLIIISSVMICLAFVVGSMVYNYYRQHSISYQPVRLIN